jgi:hypothetical protein
MDSEFRVSAFLRKCDSLELGRMTFARRPAAYLILPEAKRELRGRFDTTFWGRAVRNPSNQGTGKSNVILYACIFAPA